MGCILSEVGLAKTFRQGTRHLMWVGGGPLLHTGTVARIQIYNTYMIYVNFVLQELLLVRYTTIMHTHRHTL